MNEQEKSNDFREILTTKTPEEILAYITEHPDDPMVQDLKDFFQYYLEQTEETDSENS